MSRRTNRGMTASDRDLERKRASSYLGWLKGPERKAGARARAEAKRERRRQRNLRVVGR